MIIETIFSTIGKNGSPNFAPMGLQWGDEFVTVRPYRSTQTYSNLAANGYGVANISDNVLAYVECGLYDMSLPHFPAKIAPGVVFSDTCSWYELQVTANDGAGDRAVIKCRIIHKETRREFLGFCRASHAVIESAILATRLALSGPDKVADKLKY
ncbi:MAG TPA: DUF447 domain-containing protein, partial [Acidobacteriota bacterium]|nr:DUF447 domain-containing protein [Acidobacteriota bacterium]